jgi:hypothetical protein
MVMHRWSDHDQVITNLRRSSQVIFFSTLYYVIIYFCFDLEFVHLDKIDKIYRIEWNRMFICQLKTSMMGSIIT